MKKISIITIFLVCCVTGITFGANGNEDSANADYTDMEKAAEKVTEETVVTTERPKASLGPTKIHFYIYVVDIDNIDGASQSFTVNVYLRLRWKDERLAHKGGLRTLSLDQTWDPHVIIANRGIRIRKSFPEVVEVDCDGTVIYHQRYNGSISQPLNLSDFPFDQSTFTIQFVTAGYSFDEIEFVPETSIPDIPIPGGGMYHELSLKDWNVLKYQVRADDFVVAKGRKIPGFFFEFTAKRTTTYYILQVILPLVLIVAMASSAFYIDPVNVGAQLGVATSSMLTLIAYRFMLGNLIPRLPYMTRMDYFSLGSTVLVFLTLVEVVITTNLALRKMEKIARKVDLWCRFLFPVAFILWSVWSLILK